MKELGHEYVDVLKFDVEGAEWSALVPAPVLVNETLQYVSSLSPYRPLRIVRTYQGVLRCTLGAQANLAHCVVTRAQPHWPGQSESHHLTLARTGTPAITTPSSPYSPRLPAHPHVCPPAQWLALQLNSTLAAALS